MCSYCNDKYDFGIKTFKSRMRPKYILILYGLSFLLPLYGPSTDVFY